MLLRLMLALVGVVLALGTGAASAHEGHDHGTPAPLNLPVAPRVVSVTPELELVGVVSGRDRLTIFLHTFATNEPVRGASMRVSAGDDSAPAEPEGDGVFTLVAPWLTADSALDLVFALQLADGSGDLLAGRLERPEANKPTELAAPASLPARLAAMTDPQMLGAAAGGLMTGVLLSLLFAGRNRRSMSSSASRATAQELITETSERVAAQAGVTTLRRGAASAIAVMASAAMMYFPGGSHAAETAPAQLPSVPATMASDLAQRMPDGTLFVPKATQHLLSVRTMLIERGPAARSIELNGVIIPGPEHFGRVQPGRPGRIEAAPGGLAYIGKRVEKGELLAYVQTYIEAADRANIDSLIAETEARIEKNRTILSRYDKSPGSVPQVKVDEVRGELEALNRKRAELIPSLTRREPIFAPIGGVVSVANATIGQIVEARDVLFEIVDPSRFWVEAHAYGYDADITRDLKAAFAVIGRLKIPVDFAGRGLALRQQARVLTFQMSGRYEEIAVGMPARVVLQTSGGVDGFVLPASAIVRGSTGLPTVWIKTEPERFEPQTVKVEPLDGRSVVVTAGLQQDQRVVTDGVTLLNQIR